MCDKDTTSSNSLLLDLNSFVSADLLFRWMGAPPIWDSIHCHSNLLESVILADELLVPLPAGCHYTDLPIVSALTEKGILRRLDVDSDPVSVVRAALPQSIPLDVLPLLADWMLANHRYLTRFEHFFPVTACNTWMSFDGLYVPSSQEGERQSLETSLWGPAWAESHRKMVEHFSWGFNHGPKEVLMPQLAMSFLLRGYVYTDLAVRLRISYHAHPYRAPLLTAETLQCAGILPSFADMTTRWVNSFRAELLTSPASCGAEPYVELGMPSLYACVLKESKSLDESLDVALQMRDSGSARAYRACARSVMDDLRANRTTKLREIAQDLDNLASRMRKEFGAEETTASISLWLFSFSANVPRFLHKAVWNGPHLRLLHDTVAKAIEIAGLKGELERLGVDPQDRLPF